MTPNHDASIDFLQKWSRTGPWSLTAILPDKRTISTRTFTDLSEARTWLGEINRDHNVYFNVNPLTRAIDKKAKKDDVAAMTWLHVDIDPRPGEDISQEQERAIGLLRNPSGGVAPPTVIVYSGGGYQGFWKLDEPFKVDGQVALCEEGELYNKQLENVFGADHCHNVDRIMRLPGTINWPDKKKRAKGRKPALAKVIEWHDDRTYKLSQFTKASPLQGKSDGFDPNVEISGNVKRFGSVDELDEMLPDTGVKLTERCKVVIVQGNTADHDDKQFPSRSEALFFVCCEMVRAGFDNDTIYSVITDPDFGISESVLEKKGGADRYAKKQIRSAREKAIKPELQEMNERHAVIGEIGGKCRVITEYVDDITGRPGISKQSFEDVRNRYCNRYVKVGENKEGDPKFEPLGHWWLKHTNRRFYDRMVFAPGKVVKGSYNLWRGFTVEAKPGSCEKYLAHARDNVCKGDPELFDYLIKWMARAVQKPHEPGFSAVVLRGEMGTGKSFLIEQFGQLFGSHFLTVSDSKFLVGSFNSHLEDCVVLFGDEAFYAGDKKHESVLKNLITSETLTIEEKGLNMRKTNNCLHMMMASNSDWVVPAGLKDRRFFVLDVGDDHVQDHKYFAGIHDELSNGGYEALLYHLQTLDISKFNFRQIPATEGLTAQKRHSLSPEQEWWLVKLQEGNLLDGGDDWPETVVVRVIDNDFIRHVRKTTSHRRSSTIKLRMFLESVLPEGSFRKFQDKGTVEVVDPDGTVVELNRPYTYSIPTLKACREHWDKKFANLGEWSEPNREAVNSADNVGF